MLPHQPLRGSVCTSTRDVLALLIHLQQRLTLDGRGNVWVDSFPYCTRVQLPDVLELCRMTYGLSRDDVGRFLNMYISDGIMPADPFQVCSQQTMCPHLVMWLQMILYDAVAVHVTKQIPPAGAGY